MLFDVNVTVFSNIKMAHTRTAVQIAKVASVIVLHVNIAPDSIDGLNA